MSALSVEAIHDLMEAARQAAARAYAPYSNFPVGAAIRAGDGRVFTGANIENASYGLALCAERTALAEAVMAGYGRHTSQPLTAMAVWAARNDHGAVTPCGACRQVMAEFLASDAEILLMEASSGEVCRQDMDALLPGAFGLS